MLTNILPFWYPKLREAFISVAQGHDIAGFTEELKELDKPGLVK